MISYDRAMLEDSDMELASALWRRFFAGGELDAVRLELLVKYVRQTLQMLDNLSHDHFIAGKRIPWLTLEEVNSTI